MKLVKLTDQRVKAISEVVTGIKVLQESIRGCYHQFLSRPNLGPEKAEFCWFRQSSYMLGRSPT